MKICYLLPDRGIPLDGTKGASAHVRGLVHALVELGHEVTVIAPRMTSHPQDVLPGARCRFFDPPAISRLALESQDPPLARALVHIWNNAAAETVLRQATESEHFDCLYERLSPFGIAGSLSARERNLFHVMEVNAPLAWEGTRYRKQAMAAEASLLERDVLQHASLIVAVSDTLRDLLIETGAPADHVVVVPNGVDADLFRPDGDRERNGSGEDDIVVGFVGSLKPWHGLDILAEAFAHLAEDPRYHLLVVGSGPEERIIYKLAERFPGRVTLQRAVPHEAVPRYVRAMDIAVAPYPPLDPFYFSPLKLLEYMSAGRAIVASDIGQVSSLVQDGTTALLVPAGDATRLCDAIRTLSKDSALRERLGARARAEAMRTHRWSDRAKLITDLVRSRAAC